MANIKEIIKGNKRLTIFREEDEIFSWEDLDFLSTIYTWHRRYNIGDKHEYETTRDFLEDLLLEYTDIETEGLTIKQIEEEISKYVCMLPIYMYDHSGVTIRTYPFNCPWDSGQIGFAYISKEDFYKETEKTNVDDEEIKRQIINEVRILDAYINGEFYGFVLEEKDGEEYYAIDSCTGFLIEDISKNIPEEFKEECKIF